MSNACTEPAVSGFKTENLVVRLKLTSKKAATRENQTQYYDWPRSVFAAGLALFVLKSTYTSQSFLNFYI